MHIEKNVACTLMGLLLGDDDIIAVRKDMMNTGVMPELHLMRDGDSNNYVMPHAPYVLRRDEKIKGSASHKGCTYSYQSLRKL